MHRPENIERQEEKESDRVDIKLKRHLVIEFLVIKDTEKIWGSLRSLGYCGHKFKDSHTEPIRKNQR